MCSCLNKNQFLAVKRLQLFKQKLIPSKRKHHLNDGNPKLEIFVWRVSIALKHVHINEDKNTRKKRWRLKTKLMIKNPAFIF